MSSVDYLVREEGEKKIIQQKIIPCNILPELKHYHCLQSHSSIHAYVEYVNCT